MGFILPSFIGASRARRPFGRARRPLTALVLLAALMGAALLVRSRLTTGELTQGAAAQQSGGRHSGDRHSGGRQSGDRQFYWRKVEPGYAMARFELGDGNQLLRSEVFLLKFSPIAFSFHVVDASQVQKQSTDVRTLTEASGGVAGINAHFFDKEGSPLGLIISNGAASGKMHRGGKLLTGVFYMSGDQPAIVSREEFDPNGVELALQSGPRLIKNAKPVKLSGSDVSTRRSGVAITRDGEIILFATLLRFPGATFREIQEMLMHPALEVVEALNLDGGGSSQLFIKKNLELVDDTFITGGDMVPVGLIVKRK